MSHRDRYAVGYYDWSEVLQDAVFMPAEDLPLFDNLNDAIEAAYNYGYEVIYDSVNGETIPV